MEPIVELLTYTSEPERLVAVAARRSFRNKNSNAISSELSEKDVERIVRTVISKNHLGVLEHIYFTFEISGVSRVLTHQLVRHRIASYSQLSQQRTDSSRLEFAVPPEVERNTELAEAYREMVLHCQEFYKYLIKHGVSRGSARYILPASFGTKIIATLNARSLFNLLAQRECRMEEWEFREVAHLMHQKLMGVAPAIFRFAGPPCQTHGFCPEDKEIQECREFLGIMRIAPEREEKIPVKSTT